MKGANGVDWLARRIMDATTQAQRDAMRTPPRYNPRPPGVLYPDSATTAILQYLGSGPGVPFFRWQLIAATGCTRKSVDWALVYLSARGLVRVHAGAVHNRYSVAAVPRTDGVTA